MDNETVDGGHLSYANYRKYINLNLLLPMAGELIWKQKECDIHDTKDTHASAWGRYGYLLKKYNFVAADMPVLRIKHLRRAISISNLFVTFLKP